MLAYNEATADLDYYPILATIVHEDQVVQLLTIAGETIVTTPNHPFKIGTGEWLPAGELQVGDTIYTAHGGTGTIEAIAFVYQPQPMYNLTVATAHTYFVGDGQWLVHNVVCPTVESARILGGTLGLVDSKIIRFTQDSISSKFKNGNSVQETIEKLRAGTILSSDFPPIRIFEVEGHLFSLDNRRLYVFQQAGLPINTVPATAQEIANESFKFTTRNGGTSIRVRGG